MNAANENDPERPFWTTMPDDLPSRELIMADDIDIIRFWVKRGYEVYDKDDGLAYMRRRHVE